METRRLDSVVDLFEMLMTPQGNGQKKVVFRGVSSVDHQLIPSFGRVKSIKAIEDSEERLLRETILLDDFRKFARPYFESGLPDDWELIAIAQHHGLPSRLLDWTRNPLVAAYFAVESLGDTDGAIFTYAIDQFTSTANLDPFYIDTTITVELPHVTRRMTAQSGLFTVSSDPFVAMEDQPDTSPSLTKYVISADHKRKVLGRLHRLGITRATLFPGAEGIAQHLRWELLNTGVPDAD